MQENGSFASALDEKNRKSIQEIRDELARRQNSIHIRHTVELDISLFLFVCGLLIAAVLA